jgi:ubiquinone/menaquinone biosynthesis C-methylase UbiE
MASRVLCGELIAMLPRILEPEVMDSAEDAHEYYTMDHSIVNAQFVSDLLAAVAEWPLDRSARWRILDLGAGTAQIPIELAKRDPDAHLTAVDAAVSMLAVAHQNVAAAALTDRIALALADAKELPFESGEFLTVISNSIVHHIAEPRWVLAEAFRVTAPGGLLFHRDLARPNDEETLRQLVATYAASSTPYQRNLFTNSLRAALTLDEMRQLVEALGFSRNSVEMTSDRHWTWLSYKPPPFT